MDVIRPFFLFIFLFIAALITTSSIASAQQSCECSVQVGNQNRWIWGSWALECNNHGGHGDCPTSNIDSAHSAGSGAMVGHLVILAVADGQVRSRWAKEFPDNHVSAFKGPIWHEDDWTWTNVCSCDGYNQNSCGRSPASQWWDPNRPMYAGALNSPEYVNQVNLSRATFPYACGDSRNSLKVYEQIEENDPYSPNDEMGEISVAVVPEYGDRTKTIWAQHYEPAYVNGSRTHAGYAGGYFGAEIVIKTNCNNVGSATTPSTGGTYIGCFTDDSKRALPYALGSGHNVESCINAARSVGLPFAGLQWYGQCFGGHNAAYSKVGDHECNTPCDSNRSQVCGGAWRNSIYSTGN